MCARALSYGLERSIIHFGKNYISKQKSKLNIPEMTDALSRDMNNSTSRKRRRIIVTG